MQNWYDIWSNRKLDTSKNNVLEQLLAVDGMDTKFGSLTPSDWLAYIQNLANTIGLNYPNSDFRFNCFAWK